MKSVRALSAVGIVNRLRPPVSRATANIAIARTTLAALALITAFPVCADEPMAQPNCAMQISVEVTPDVPDPSDSGFISSLLGAHPQYQLFLLQATDDTHVSLQLQGPGPAERCQAVVDSIRNDGRVSSIDVI